MVRAKRSYFLNISQNDDLQTVIKKCNYNFQAFLTNKQQENAEINIDVDEIERIVNGFIVEITDQIDDEANTRANKDDDLNRAIIQESTNRTAAIKDAARYSMQTLTNPPDPDPSIPGSDIEFPINVLDKNDLMISNDGQYCPIILPISSSLIDTSDKTYTMPNGSTFNMRLDNDILYITIPVSTEIWYVFIR